MTKRTEEEERKRRSRRWEVSEEIRGKGGESGAQNAEAWARKAVSSPAVSTCDGPLGEPRVSSFMRSF